MQAFSEISIDLTAQELLTPPALDAAAMPRTRAVYATTELGGEAANSPLPPPPALDDTVEIELTAEQMDALLSGILP